MGRLAVAAAAGLAALVLAPHIGSATTEARTQMASLCADAVVAVLAGRRPKNVVNPEVYA